MAQRRLRRIASVGRLSGASCGFFLEERKVIPQLLELFRSGALASLLPPASPVVAGGVQTQKPDKVPTKKGRQGSQTVEKPQVPESGWSPVKRATTSAAPVKDKLVNDGWSVPIVASIADFKTSQNPVCVWCRAQRLGKR